MVHFTIKSVNDVLAGYIEESHELCALKSEIETVSGYVDLTTDPISFLDRFMNLMGKYIVAEGKKKIFEKNGQLLGFLSNNCIYNSQEILIGKIEPEGFFSRLKNAKDEDIGFVEGDMV